MLEPFDTGWDPWEHMVKLTNQVNQLTEQLNRTTEAHNRLAMEVNKQNHHLREQHRILVELCQQRSQPLP